MIGNKANMASIKKIRFSRAGFKYKKYKKCLQVFYYKNFIKKIFVSE